MVVHDGRENATLDAVLLRRRLADRGEALAVVKGTSMLPLLRHGDIVRLEPCPLPRIGDVVAVAGAHTFVVHRVVSVEGHAIVCRGDNRGAPDAPVLHEAVLGRVAAVAGNGGRRRRRPVLQGRAGAVWGSVCHRVVRARGVGAHAAGELRLLRAQVRGTTAAVCEVPEVPGERTFPDGVAAAGDSRDAGCVVDAWQMGVLDAERRRATVAAVLAASAGAAPATATVYAFVRDRRYRLARIGAGVRAVAMACGLRWGTPGDTCLMTARGPRAVHLFTAAELGTTVAEAGGDIIDLRAASDGAGLPLWAAQARFCLLGETRRL